LPDRDPEHERLLGIVFKLSPNRAATLSVLLKCTYVSSEKIMEYAGFNSPVKQAIWHIRAALHPLGVEVGNRQGVGYWIDKDDKAKVEHRVEEFLKG